MCRSSFRMHASMRARSSPSRTVFFRRGARPPPPANRLNYLVYVLGTSSLFFGLALHPIPEGPESSAPITVPDVAAHKVTHDLARTSSLPPGQTLEALFEVVVDPYGELGPLARERFL